ncbi:MAG TPA: hypothetical protein VF816_14405 [Rhodocyclaceae bacterium]
MGTLVAMKYPSKLFLEAADHTYVQCGNGGRAWGCWGGKTGGTAFNTGSGSTRRADAIAGSNERAGVTCYLINGVCHTAANRILFPAGILVSGARGFALSSSLFGIYGKTGIKWLPCYAPFNQQAGVTGDLPACAEAAPKTKSKAKAATAKSQALGKHLQLVRQAYAKLDPEKVSPLDSMQFQMKLFDQEVRFRLGESVSAKVATGMRHAKESVELRHHHMAEAFHNEDMSAAEFVKAFNAMTLKFQNDIANAASATQYKKFLELDRDEKVILALPEGVEAAFGADTAQAVYGSLR